MSDSKEVLVVASKLKKFIKEQSGMNTSASVFEVLSEKVRDLCLEAIENAKSDGRKTVKDRDIPQSSSSSESTSMSANVGNFS